MIILVTGKNGQLGSEIRELSKSSEHTFVFTDSKDCDIRDIEALETVIDENKVDAIINCAAYTKVDLAEDEQEEAFETNVTGVRNINEIAEMYGLKYIHISTDYVFDGQATTPYKTMDPVAPTGVYGKTKLKGEEIVANSNADAIIIRTSWVYSSFGHNFVKTMFYLGSERDELSVVNDQTGCPTYAKDLAEACLKIIEHEELCSVQHIYHFSNSGAITWYTFAKKIMELKSINCTIIPITTDQYPTKAKRPAYSVLDTSDIQRDFGIIPRPWDEALEECLKLL